EDSVSGGAAAAAATTAAGRSRRARRRVRGRRRRVVLLSGMADGVLRKEPPFVAREYIEQFGQRAVAVWHPVRAAIDAREHGVDSFRSWLVARNDLRMALVVESFHPSLPDEAFAEEEFAAVPVQQVVEAVPRRPCHQLPRPPIIGGVEEDGNLGGVPIVGIVRRKLVIP